MPVRAASISAARIGAPIRPDLTLTASLLSSTPDLRRSLQGSDRCLSVSLNRSRTSRHRGNQRHRLGDIRGC